MRSNYPDLVPRPLTASEQHFYSVMLQHYEERLKVCPAPVIKNTVRTYKKIVQSNTILTKNE